MSSRRSRSLPFAGRCLVGAVVALSLTATSSASARTFCVHRTHCHGTKATSLGAAVRAAAANGPKRDLILVGAGRFRASVVDSARNTFNLAGLGRRTTVLAGRGGFSLTNGSNVSRLRMLGSGLTLTGTADGVVLDSGLFANDGARFRHGVVRVAGRQEIGIGVSTGRVLVEDSRVTSANGIINEGCGGCHADVGGTITVRRTRITASDTGLRSVDSISDSTIVVHGGGTAIDTDCTFATNEASNVTLIGDGTPGSTGAVTSTERESGNPYGCFDAHLNLRSSIVRGFATSLKEDRGGPCVGQPGPENPYPGRDCPPGRHDSNVLTASYSDYDPSRVQNDRPVSVDGGHNVNVDPRFVNAGLGDFHLRFDSPVVGAGAPSRPAGLGNRDIDGHRRVVDADHDGQPVIDMGAHEYQGTGPRPAIALNTRRPYVFQDTRFNGVASSDPDGGGLTYRWQFGDRRTATGRHVTHHYTEAGVYRIYLTVRDYQGLRSFTTRTIKVRPAPVLCGHRC